MARIAGVDLPRNKRVEIGLTYVFGIGNTSAKQIVKDAKIAPGTLCGGLTDQEVNNIRGLISENYQTEGDLFPGEPWPDTWEPCRNLTPLHRGPAEAGFDAASAAGGYKR